MEKQKLLNILSSVSLIFALLGIILRLVSDYAPDIPFFPCWVLSLVLSIVSIHTKSTAWGIILLIMAIILLLAFGLLYIYALGSGWKN